MNRRRLLRSLAWLGATPILSALDMFAKPGDPILTRKIPSSGEELPVVGLGTWMTFNVGNDAAARDQCTVVVRAFLESGGRLIDSSPMYGSAQPVIGYALARLGRPKVFAADKVWISSGARGAAQIEESRRHWGVPRFDLVQIHNLVSWEAHLPALFAAKKAGRVRYVGVTTSHGRRHDELEAIMRREPLDFVQLTYNPLDREVEARLLPLARDRGMAVIVNRPFQQGALTRRLERDPLPAWARELGCQSWAQLILKFIVSHPAVTCAIPATSVVAHARENVNAARGAMPDAPAHRAGDRSTRMTSEWWTYRLSDFLLFSPRTYYRLFELYNRDVWPAHVVAIGAGVLMLIFSVRRRPWSGRMISVMLGAAWLWIAWAFHLERYAAINWAAKWFAAAFVVQGLLLMWAGFSSRRAAASRPYQFGLGLFVFALAIEPFLGIAAGRSWSQIELFGLAPDPTALGTLGILLFLGRPWLLVIPILWCAISGATLWAMRVPDALVLPAAALLVLVVSVRSR